MKSTLRYVISAGVFAASALAAQAKIERTVERIFTVPNPGTLHVETQGGGIRVTSSSDGTVKVTARETIKADSEAEADALLKKLELTIEQSGSDITATAKYERQMPGFHIGSWPPVQVEFIISVPTTFAADLHTSGGGITVGDLAGKAVVRTSGGSIKLGKMGSTVDARTSGGGISLAEADGDVDLRTSGGSIKVGRVAASAQLSTSGGGINIDSVENAVQAHTSGGSITAGIVGPLKQDCTFATSGGGVRVTVDRSAAFRLDASTSGGGVNAEGLTLTLESSERNRSRLAGTVNGGGPVLKLRSSGGGISVHPR